MNVGIGGWITGQINTWFANLVALSIKPLLELLAGTVLSTPSVSGQARIQDLWQATAAIANAAFVLLVVLAGILVMGHETVQTRHAFKEIAPRLAVAFGLVNFSFFLTSQLIDLANGVSSALLGQDFDAKRASNTIRYMILPTSDNQIFYTLLGLVAVVLLVLLLITFVFRLAMTTLLVIAAPLALACLALPQTDGLTRLWWKAFSGLLLIQVAQSLTLVTAVRIFFNQDGREAAGLQPAGQLYNLLLALCLLVILVRIPGWVSRAVFLPSRGSTIGRMVKYAVAYKLTSPVLRALHLGRSGGGGGRGGGSGGGGGGRAAAAKAVAGRVLPALAAGPAAPAAAALTGAAAAASVAGTAAGAAVGGPGPVKHAPVGARRPAREQDWELMPVKHAPTGLTVAGKYRPTPRLPGPVPAIQPVYGYPRETYYAAGPAGLGQMQQLRAQAQGRAIEPPPRPAVRPIVAPNAPIPGTPEWPENPGTPRRTPPRRRTRRPRGDDGR
ncbi:conjugal transfer protein TrbL family protein [Nonomuraea sp. NPDC049152]|uniref:conjugal transfer protein TrbL family protein n=1 Tax=Nonomuraea sp. NPDC049152 TaxID=3154350 RepID=UPI0033E422EA